MNNPTNRNTGGYPPKQPSPSLTSHHKGFTSPTRSSGFTLIELLVVIAIIGILASVVLASLNSARAKGRETAIKSNLRNMIAAAELSYDVAGNYSGACTAVQPMIDAIVAAGGTAACQSVSNTRWGVSATNADKTKNWSADGTGVFAWGSTDAGTFMTWDAAVATCSAAGGTLPSVEQLKALYAAHGTTPVGFPNSESYWSSTEASATTAYYVHLYPAYPGSHSTAPKTNARRVRCMT